MSFSSVELCAGAGGQALGIEKAGFHHEALVEIDDHCRNTLQLNRPKWNVLANDQSDITCFNGKPYKGIDLLAGGLPCPPFSVAGKQLGTRDERNLFPDAIRLIDEIRPKAVMIENVKGFLAPVFENYRDNLKSSFAKLGYVLNWKILNASEYGVSQLRPRVVLVGMRRDLADLFEWPSKSPGMPVSVGELLDDLMGANGWRKAAAWKHHACDIAPTIVGGSKKHGGPDLGPTRARKAWAMLGVDGLGIANDSPDENFDGMPRLTVPMVSRLQGFPDDWIFSGKKTPAYRQVGNAFPPPVAQAVANQIARVFSCSSIYQVVA